MICDRCYQLLSEGEHGLFLCPLEPRRSAPTIWRDEIPGGVLIEHGLCNPDGTPRRFDSRSEMRLAAQVKGVVPWTDVYTEDRTKDARVQMDWQRSGEAQRQRRDRDEMRREGVRPESRPQAPPTSSDPRRRAEIARIARDVVASHR